VEKKNLKRPNEEGKIRAKKDGSQCFSIAIMHIAFSNIHPAAASYKKSLHASHACARERKREREPIRIDINSIHAGGGGIHFGWGGWRRAWYRG